MNNVRVYSIEVALRTSYANDLHRNKRMTGTHYTVGLIFAVAALVTVLDQDRLTALMFEVDISDKLFHRRFKSISVRNQHPVKLIDNS